MDSLTQIVLGASVAEASLGKKIGNKAIVLGAIAGTIPDLDIVTRFFVDDLSASVTVSLYTSPSPRDVEESRMPSSA